jgi:hypothetical protein
MLYSQELAKQYPQITSVSVHPGIIMTGLFDNVSFFTKLPALLSNTGKTTPVEQGSYNQLRAATVDKSKLVNGEYYEPIGKVGVRTTKAARDKELPLRLWEWTQDRVGKVVLMVLRDWTKARLLNLYQRLFSHSI